MLRMAIWSLTKEKADSLRKLRDEKRGELDVVLRTPIKEMWLSDLGTALCLVCAGCIAGLTCIADGFVEAYDEFETGVIGDETLTQSARALNKTKPKTKASKAAAAAKKTGSAPAAAPAKVTCTTLSLAVGWLTALHRERRVSHQLRRRSNQRRPPRQ